MILLSFRKDFTSRLKFSSMPQWQGDPDYLFGKRCLFMIHGYENTAGSAEANFANIERGLQEVGLIGSSGRFDELVGVLWPGHTAPGFWFAEDAADRAAYRLNSAIASIDPRSVSFVTHSLGARIALRCLSDRILRLFEPGELVMLAPAVDDNSLEFGAPYYPERACRTLVCYSRRDEVLNKWYRRFARILNFNDVALGYSGPRNPLKCPVSVSCFDGTPYVDSHGAWMTCKEMYAVWARPTWANPATPNLAPAA